MSQIGLIIPTLIAGSGDTAAFYETLRASQANPLILPVASIGEAQLIKLLDRSRSYAGFITLTKWTNPAPLQPVLAIPGTDSGAASSCPSGPDNSSKLGRLVTSDAGVNWLTLHEASVDDGRTVSISGVTEGTAVHFA